MTLSSSVALRLDDGAQPSAGRAPEPLDFGHGTSAGLGAHRSVLRRRGPARVHRVRRRRRLGRAAARPADAAPDAPAARPRAGRRGPARRDPRPARPRPLRPARGPARLLDDRVRASRSSRCSTTSVRRRRSIGGTSLGANVSLEVAVLAPDRVRGLIVEMPVLDNALEAGILAFAPLMFAARFLPFTVTGAAAADPADPARAGAVLGRDRPRHPRPAAGADGGRRARHLLRPDRAVRRGAGARSRRRPWWWATRADPIHPAADAAMLAEEMPERARSSRAQEHPRVAGRRPDAARPALAAEFALACWEPAPPAAHRSADPATAEWGGAPLPRRGDRAAHPQAG